MLVDVWTHRELPILKAVVAADDAARIPLPFAEIAAETDIESAQVRIAVDALRGDDYLQAYMGSGGFIMEVHAKARRAVGNWPSAESLIDALAAALARAAEYEPDEERRGKLRTAADALGTVVRAAAVGEIQAIMHRYGAGVLP